MAMTINELINAYWDCAYREGKDGRTHDTPSGDAQRIRSQIDAHLSAQAKVKVTNSGLPTELRLVCGHDSRSVDGCIHCEAADAIESFDARLSQGARSEARPFIWFATDDNGSYGIGADRNSAISDLPFMARRVFPLYTHPAARLSQGAQGEDKPRAWLHILHAELSQNIEQLSVSEENPFGKRGVDYDPSYTVTSEPLYTHPAARLSQGAQGEAVAEVDELDCETGPGVPCITMLGPMPPIGTKLYTHPAERDHEMGVPSGDDGGQLFVHGSKEALQRVQWYIGQAERAAVPDEVLRKAESLRNGIHAASCRMPEGWADVAVDWQRDAQAILDWLTAVPQPPEGARVVDGWQPIESAPTDGTPHVRGLWVRTPRGSYFDAVVGGINDEGEFVDLDHDSTRWDASDYTHWHRLSAAPTLAGKEGAK